MRVTVLSRIASPYQVELFDGIAASDAIDLSVVYEQWTSSGRGWTLPSIRHDAIALTDRGASTTMASWAQNSDLVVCNWYPNRSMRSTCKEHIGCGRKVVLWGEAPRVRFGVVSKLRRRFVLPAFRNGECSIWGIGSWAVARWKAEFGARRRYENMPYFSNVERFGAAMAGDTTSRRARHFIFSGSLIKRKGVDLIAAAFARLAKDIDDVRLTWIGAGPLGNELKDQLRPFGEKVQFLGFRDWSDLPSLYQKADVLLAPSRYDGWGLIVPEGLASGLPVISTSATGAAIDLIRPGINGDIVDPGCVSSLFNAMRRIATLDAGEFRQMATQASNSMSGHQLRDGVNRFAGCCQNAVRNA